MDAIKVVGIIKCFEPVRANNGIDFTVKHQEIHCLLGENGAGKSTLMDILFGLYHPDAGEIFINERKAPTVNSSDAYVLGIGVVHQHFMLVGQLTVLENIILRKESSRFLLNRRESRARVEKLAERFGFRVDLDEKMVDLSVGMKQRVKILKTLYRGADIIILNEPTAVLTPREVEELSKILRQLKRSGKTIVFITHKLDKTTSLSDRITVIRRGKVVFYCNTQDTNEKELATWMAGRQVESVVARKGQQTGDVVLELKEVRLRKGAERAVSLTVRAGEILGMVRVGGSGQQELEEMIVGNRKVTEGSILLGGRPVHTLPVKDRKAIGIRYISSDRHKNAMVSGFSITESFLLRYQNTPEYCKKRFIDYNRLKQDASKQVEAFEIKVAGVKQEIGQPSKGNQQRVIPGREINHDPGLALVAQPVRGLDIGAIERVHKALLQLKEQGKAILLISAELSEVMSLSNRATVFYEGEASAQLTNGEYTREGIGLFMTGKRREVNVHEMDM